MKQIFNKRVIILTVVIAILFFIGLEETLAQAQYFNYVGKVISIYRDTLSVKGAKGEIMYFLVGRRTAYNPPRLPAVGEKVEVLYYLRRGYNIAYQVNIKK